jgi:hypothetical protein
MLHDTHTTSSQSVCVVETDLVLLPCSRLSNIVYAGLCPPRHKHPGDPQGFSTAHEHYNKHVKYSCNTPCMRTAFLHWLLVQELSGPAACAHWLHWQHIWVTVVSQAQARRL